MLAVVGVIGASAAIVLIVALPFKWLWNAVLPGLFSFPSLGYWQAVGMLALATLGRMAVTGAGIELKLKKPKP